MNRTPRLSPSGIEYMDYSWNFYSGCWNWKNGICPVGENCWAKGITVRFPDHYPNGFEPTYYPEAFLSPLYLKKPSIIGCAFMGDLFGDWVDPNMRCPNINWYYDRLKDIIFSVAIACPQHTFLFLTKCPWNLPKWSPFPDNCRVGGTVCNAVMFFDAINYLDDIQCSVRFLSIEPMLGSCYLEDLPAHLGSSVDWLILGACTGTKRAMLELCQRYPDLTLMPYGRIWSLHPQIEWVEEIVRAADKAGVPVFLKDNLIPLLPKREPFYKRDKSWIDPKLYYLRQEMGR